MWQLQFLLFLKILYVGNRLFMITFIGIHSAEWLSLSASEMSVRSVCLCLFAVISPLYITYTFSVNGLKPDWIITRCDMKSVCSLLLITCVCILGWFKQNGICNLRSLVGCSHVTVFWVVAYLYALLSGMGLYHSVVWVCSVCFECLSWASDVIPCLVDEETNSHYN